MNDDTLILYYYDDGLSAIDRQAVSEALAADNQLADRYRTLAAELNALRAQPANPAPPAGAADRWHAALEEVAGNPGTSSSSAPWYSVWLFPAAAALVLGIGVGLRMGGTPPLTVADMPSAMTPNNAAAPAPLARGVAAYMQRSRTQLAGLDAANGDERAALIAELVAQNRLFERRATDSGATELARVLRAFDQLLASLSEQAGNDGDVSAEREQLSFEYAVMLTKLRAAPSDNSHSL